VRIGRTLPPAAAPLGGRELAHALGALIARRDGVAAREAEIRREFGVDHVFLVSSGSAALTLSLRALHAVGRKRDVIIPAYTCYSVPAAVLHAGLRLVLCDIDPATLDFDHAQLERTLTDDTLCVVTPHLFGRPAAIARIRALCAARRVFVVEDAAQGMGGDVRGQKLGTFGDVGIFSFGRGKNVTCGSGGAILTGCPAIATELAVRYRDLPSPPASGVIADFLKLALMVMFIRPRLYWIPSLLPFLHLGETHFPDAVPLRRLGRVKAALLAGWQTRLAQSNDTRSEIAADVRRRLNQGPSDGHPYLRVPLLAPTPAMKTKLQMLARIRGLGVSGGYPAPVSEIPQIREAFRGQRFPAAEHVAARLVTMPTHRWVLERDRQAIADLYRTCCQH
jgi:dTDP-4-amino-4,6-dideoxygalactose transaminase